MLRFVIIPVLVAGAYTGSHASAQVRTGLGAPLPQSAFSRLETGPLEAAFADGPIKLSPAAVRVLQARFQTNKIPIIPDPFRRQLDTALMARDWPRVIVRKADLAASRGEVAMLMWEQTRFLSTGSLWLAELHARDLAASGLPTAGETAVMMWFYAVAATMTDGQQCATDGARDAHLAALRGKTFDPVLAIVRTLPEDRLMKQRDTALKLEAALAPDRNDDTVCRTGSAAPAIRPVDEWRVDAARTREIAAKHLNAISALVRAKPMTPAPQPVAAGPVAAPPRR